MARILAIDYGGKRIGLAIGDTDVRFARPLQTIINGPDLLDRLKGLIDRETISELVVGLPRGLDGQETSQTATARDFAKSLEQLNLPVALQDEAGTTSKARDELEAKKRPFAKTDVDKLAATYILEDYLLGIKEKV